MSAKSAWTGARPHIDKSELLCKKGGCGFYGYPAFEGHCSVCFKEQSQKKQQRRTVFDPAQLKNKVTQSVSDVTELQSKASSIVSRKLDKFDAKIDKKTKAVKSMFKKSPSLVPQEKGKVVRQYSNETQATIEDFQCYVKQMNSEKQSYINRQLKLFDERIQKLGVSHSVDDLSELFQDFYNIFNDALNSSQIFADLSQEEIEKVNDLLEKFVTTRYHKTILSVVNLYSEENDLAIQNRIRSLMWVTATHLDCKINDSDEEVRAVLDKVIADLIGLDRRKTPSEKLSLVVSASHEALNLLQLSNGGTPASADDFLPTLIYCVLRANPPLLHSNISYITSFAQPPSLQRGEAGYFFTNLCCAVSFIEKLTAESLGLTEIEFDYYMSGEALPPNALEDTYLCESLQMMQQTLSNLTEYETSLRDILKNYDDLFIEIKDLRENVDVGLQDLQEKYPLVIQSKKADIDERDPELELLPPPLTPENLKSGVPESANLSLIDSVRDFIGNAPLQPTPFEITRGPRSLDSFYDDSPPLHPISSSTGSSPRNNQPHYTGFTIQGGRIPSIPCDTGLSRAFYSNVAEGAQLQKNENSDSLL